MNKKEIKNVLKKEKGREVTEAKGYTRAGEKAPSSATEAESGLGVKLKAVVRPRPEDKDAFDFRVFDEAQAAAKKVTIKDYNSLDEHPDLIVYEGWFDKKAMKVQMEEKKSPGVIRKWRL